MDTLKFCVSALFDDFHWIIFCQIVHIMHQDACQQHHNKQRLVAVPIETLSKYSQFEPAAVQRACAALISHGVVRKLQAKECVDVDVREALKDMSANMKCITQFNQEFKKEECVIQFRCRFCGSQFSLLDMPIVNDEFRCPNDDQLLEEHSIQSDSDSIAQQQVLYMQELCECALRESSKK